MLFPWVNMVNYSEMCGITLASDAASRWFLNVISIFGNSRGVINIL